MLKHLNIDAVLKALAEPTRRELMERLSKAPASVSDLAAPYSMSLAAIVQHLQVLEECGLIKSEKIGRVRTCRIEPGGLDGLSQWIATTRTTTEKRLDRLGDLLAGMAEDGPAD
jgi:DNA-binding transcriptional ArsR family regulator